MALAVTLVAFAASAASASAASLFPSAAAGDGAAHRASAAPPPPPPPGPTPWPTLGPTLPPSVSPVIHGPVTIFLAATTALLTLILAFQVFRVYYYRHRALSCFNLCLTSCLGWGILRTILLGFYAARHHVASHLTLVEYMALFVAPTCLQFLTFSAVALHFAMLVLKDFSEAAQVRGAIMYRVLCVAANLGFIITNVVCSVVLAGNDTDQTINATVRARVIVSELFNILTCVSLLASAYKFRRLVAKGDLLEGSSVTSRQILIFTGIITPLFVSRAIYNFVAIGNAGLNLWGYRWTFLSDQADRRSDDGWSFVAFVIALFVWEIVPVILVLTYFWVRPLHGYNTALSHANPRSVLLGPRRDSDSDDDFSIDSMSYGSFSPTYGDDASVYDDNVGSPHQQAEEMERSGHLRYTAYEGSVN